MRRRREGKVPVKGALAEKRKQRSVFQAEISVERTTESVGIVKRAELSKTDDMGVKKSRRGKKKRLRYNRFLVPRESAERGPWGIYI